MNLIIKGINGKVIKFENEITPAMRIEYIFRTCFHFHGFDVGYGYKLQKILGIKGEDIIDYDNRKETKRKTIIPIITQKGVKKIKCIVYGV